MPNEVGVTRRHGLKAAAAAAVAGPLLTTAGPTQPASAGEHPGALDVMTFNVRFGTVVDTTPRWEVRRPVMRELLRRERPHLIGTQEGLYRQVRAIEKDLGAHYDWIGTGRAGGSKDEFMAVFYDTRRLTPVEFDHFWLSDTPYTIASNTWGADWLRMVTWVRFVDLADGGGSSTSSTPTWTASASTPGNARRGSSARRSPGGTGRCRSSSPVTSTRPPTTTGCTS